MVTARVVRMAEESCSRAAVRRDRGAGDAWRLRPAARRRAGGGARRSAWRIDEPRPRVPSAPRRSGSCRRPTTPSRSCSTCPPTSRDAFAYEAGQFCTFRVRIGDEDLLRCYSMSSSPHTDAELTTTVKRVPGGRVSNWMLDEVAEGDVLVLTRPAGVFTLRPPLDAARRVQRGERHHAGDLGDQERAGHHRPIGAVAVREPRPRVGDLRAELDALVVDVPEPVGGRAPPRRRARLRPLRRGDAVRGRRPRRRLLRVRSGTVHGRGRGRAGLAARAVGPRVHRALRLRRAAACRDEPPATPATVADDDGGDEDRRHRARRAIARGAATKPGETFLETARRAGLRAPFSCEAGSCATCMAHVVEGEATMRVNNALTPEEVDEGWVLTCQGFPTSSDRQGGLRVVTVAASCARPTDSLVSRWETKRWLRPRSSTNPPRAREP